MTNLELVRAAYEAFERGDVEGVLASFDPDIEWIEPDGYWPGARGVHRGVDAVRRIFATYPERWAEWTVVPEEFVDAGDVVLMRGRCRFRAHGGSDVEMRLANVWRLRDGRAVQLQVLADSALVWRALGGRDDYWDDRA